MRGGVLCPGFPVGAVSREALGCVGSPAEQLVKSDRLAVIGELISGLVAGLRHMLALGWPRVACGGGGLVLVLKRSVRRSDACFELLPPSGHGRQFASGLGLALVGWPLAEPAAFQFGPGLRGGVPNAGGGGGPLLIAGTDGFELSASGPLVKSLVR